MGGIADENGVQVRGGWPIVSTLFAVAPGVLPHLCAIPLVSSTIIPLSSTLSFLICAQILIAPNNSGRGELIQISLSSSETFREVVFDSYNAKLDVHVRIEKQGQVTIPDMYPIK